MIYTSTLVKQVFIQTYPGYKSSLDALIKKILNKFNLEDITYEVCLIVIRLYDGIPYVVEADIRKPKQYSWRVNRSYQPFGPVDISVFKGYLIDAREFYMQVQELPDEEIVAMIDEFESERDRFREISARERDVTAFFNRKASAADVAFWTAMNVWTPEQAVALSFGKDPNKVYPEVLKPYRKVGRSIFTETFEKRLLLLQSAIDRKRLSTPLDPTKVVQWAKTQPVSFENAFEIFVDLNVSEQESPDKSDSVNTKSANTLYNTLLLLMATAMILILLRRLRQGKTTYTIGWSRT